MRRQEQGRKGLRTAIVAGLLCLLAVLSCGCAADLSPVATAIGPAPTDTGPAQAGTENEASSVGAGDDILERAFAERAEGLPVEGEGRVTKILADDNEGDRHQRFVIALASGQTLLITHNIDVAPRIKDLRVGDIVSFKGEYVWNQQGGLIHWTHHDPSGDHFTGWLRHDGQTYQ